MRTQTENRSPMSSKTLIRVVGITLTLSSIVFLGFFISRHFTGLLDSLHSLTTLEIIGLIAASAIFGALLSVKGIGWFLLINHMVDQKLSLAVGIYVHGSTQIMKYIPGNVFHYIGRQIKGAHYGWPQITIAASSIVESALTITGGVLVSLAFLIFIPRSLFPVVLSEDYHLAIPLIGIVVLFLLLLLVRKAGGHLGNAPRLLEPFAVVTVMLPALIINAVFFLMSGITLFFCAWTLGSTIDPNTIGYFLAIYPIAWLAGYLTPGAPGGLGIRETLLILGLSHVVGEANAVLTALLFRLVSIIGEILYFAIAEVMFARLTQLRRIA